MSASAPSVVFHNGFIHSSSDPFATAIFIEDGVVAWIGDEDSAQSFKKRAEQVIDLEGALIAPAFVDTHVHILETALSAASVPVGPAHGGHSVEALFALLAPFVDAAGGGVVTATGFDDSLWLGPKLTVDALSSRFENALLYVPRADLHSAFVTSALAELAGVDNASIEADGRVAGDAHTQVREYVYEAFAAERNTHYVSVLNDVASKGIVAVHENSAVGIDSRAGLAELIEMTKLATSGLPLVVGYRGELVTSVDEAQDLRAQIPGLRGLAGDLSVDGSFGSRSAALREPYCDDAENYGRLHLSQEQVTEHLRACSEAGISAGFHVIGDKALDVVVAAVRLLADEPGMQSKMRRAGHRLEHVELADTQSIDLLARNGFMVSVQPAFDANWGAPGGMYQERLGQERSAHTNPLASFLKAGLPVGFGSDTPVTSLDPWGTVAAAVFHNQRESRISARAAFKAHTRGGWRLSGEQNPLVGEIRIGAPAHLAVWRAAELGVQAENDGRSSWSTDPRAGSPLLPILEPEALAQGERPACLATLRDGVFIHRA